MVSDWTSRRPPIGRVLLPLLSIAIGNTSSVGVVVDSKDSPRTLCRESSRNQAIAHWSAHAVLVNRRDVSLGE